MTVKQQLPFNVNSAEVFVEGLEFESEEVC